MTRVKAEFDCGSLNSSQMQMVTAKVNQAVREILDEFRNVSGIQAQFSETPNLKVDPASAQLCAHAMNLQKKNPKLSFGEALRQARPNSEAAVPKFNETPNLRVDQASVELCAAAMALQEANPKLNFGEALREARRRK